MVYNYIDISLDKDKVLISDKFDFILQEIKILFDTAPGEVLGENEFGADFERYIWDLNIGNSQISSYVLDLIKNNTMSGSDFNISVSTNIMYGTQHDIIIVKINIKDPNSNDSVTTTYKII